VCAYLYMWDFLDLGDTLDALLVSRVGISRAVFLVLVIRSGIGDGRLSLSLVDLTLNPGIE
jgi:hypothetical protein